jgi:hypothetical protein
MVRCSAIVMLMTLAGVGCSNGNRAMNSAVPQSTTYSLTTPRAAATHGDTSVAQPRRQLSLNRAKHQALSSPLRPGAAIESFGREASAPTRSTVATLIKTYFSALRRHQDTLACDLLSARLRAGIERRHQRGTVSCVSLLSNRLIAGDDNGVISVRAVRVRATLGYALLRTRALSAEDSVVPVVEEAGSWHVDGLIPVPVGIASPSRN